MTPVQARTKEHWHVRDSEGLRPEPYGSPAAAKGAMTIRGEPMPGFRVQKIGLRGACPCREASSACSGKSAVSKSATAKCGDARSADAADSVSSPPVRQNHILGKPRDHAAGASVSSHRKVQAPERGGATTNKPKPGHQHHAGAATSAVPTLQPSDDPSVAPATTYGHAELQHLQHMNGDEYGG